MASGDNKLLLGINNNNPHFDEDDSSGGGVIDWSKVGLTLRLNWYWCLIIIISCVVLAKLYDRYTLREFESQSVLQLKFESKVQDVGLNIGGLGPEGKSNYSSLSEEIELIRSAVIFDRVIQTLQLEHYYLQFGNVLDDERYGDEPFEIVFNAKKGMPYDVPIFVRIKGENELDIYNSSGSKTISTTFDAPIDFEGLYFTVKKTNRFDREEIGREFCYIRKSVNVLRSELAERLKVAVLNSNASTISISYTHSEPQKAFDIVNTIDSIYLDYSLETKKRAQDQTIAFINTQLDSASNNLRIQEYSLENFILNTGTADPSQEFSLIKDQMLDLKEEYAIVNAQLNALRQLSDDLEAGDTINTQLSFYQEINNSQLLTSIVSYNQAVYERNIKRSSIKESTMAYQLLNQKVIAERNAVYSFLENSIKMLLQQGSEIASRIKQQQNRLTNLPSLGTDLKRIQRNYDLYEKYYLMLVEKKVEFGISKAGLVPQFIVLAPPIIPSFPVYPNSTVLYISGLIFGLILSGLLLLIRFLMSNTVLSERDFEGKLNAPCVGALPQFRKEKMPVSRVVVDKNPKSSITEAMRSIRTNLDFIHSGDRLRISVTSTISGEGKTFVAVNLGAILASTGKKVIVLDLDMRKPKVNFAFDVPNINGMSNLLIGKSTLDEVIQNTHVENLDVITSGPTPPNPSELILRNSFDTMLNELDEKYDVVLIDSPPVGLVTDGILIMKKVDVPIYVVRSGYSNLSVIKKINALVSGNKFQNLSVVLNSVKVPMKYGYGYGYGYYED